MLLECRAPAQALKEFEAALQKELEPLSRGVGSGARGVAHRAIGAAARVATCDQLVEICARADNAGPRRSWRTPGKRVEREIDSKAMFSFSGRSTSHHSACSGSARTAGRCAILAFGAHGKRRTGVSGAEPVRVVSQCL